VHKTAEKSMKVHATTALPDDWRCWQTDQLLHSLCTNYGPGHATDVGMQIVTSFITTCNCRTNPNNRSLCYRGI